MYSPPVCVFDRSGRISGRSVPEFIEGDEFGMSCRVSFCSDDEGNSAGEIEGPGQYCITWHRCVFIHHYKCQLSKLTDIPELFLMVNGAQPLQAILDCRRFNHQ